MTKQDNIKHVLCCLYVTFHNMKTAEFTLSDVVGNIKHHLPGKTQHTDFARTKGCPAKVEKTKVYKCFNWRRPHMEDYLNIKSTISQQSLVGSFFILTVHTHTDKLHETNCFKYSDSRTDGLLYCVHNCLYNRTLPDASQGLSKPKKTELHKVSLN